MKAKLLQFSLAIGLILLVACSGDTKKENTDSGTSKADTSEARYVCPMDTEVVSNHPDTCVKCGMDLEKVN